MCEPFGTIEVPADRLWGAQTQRESFMEMGFYQ
jgi:fumarate hydratase class II